MKKLLNLSLVAAALCTTAMAEGEGLKTEVGGDVNVFYQTSNANNGDILSQENSQADIGISIDAIFSAGEDTYAGVKAVYIDNAGLKGSLTNGNIQGTNGDIALTEAYVAKKFGNTGLVIGRQTMNSPMIFSETERYAYANTVNAFTAVNKDFQNVTLVGAIVGGHNTIADLSTFDGEATYAIGALLAPMAGVEANAWFYKVDGGDQTVWLDAATKVAGVDVAAQYGSVSGETDMGATMFGVKAATDFEGIRLTAAYNSVDTDAMGANGAFKNQADAAATARTSLFTQAWNNADDIAGKMGATVDSGLVSAELTAGAVDYKVAYACDFEDNSEIDLGATTTFGDLDVQAVLAVNTDAVDTETSATILATYKF